MSVASVERRCMLRMPREQVQSQFTLDARARQPWVGSVRLTVLVGAAYFLTSRLSVLLLAKSGAAMFWPAAGISGGTLIALGRDARGPVAIGTITANIAANIVGGRNVWISVIFGLCNAGEALLVAWLIERFIGRQFSLGRFRHAAGISCGGDCRDRGLGRRRHAR